MNVFLVRQGDRFPVEYTTMLKRMVREHAGIDALVLGDGEDANIPLRYGFTGYWSKIELFSPELEPYRPLFFLDLDTYILSDIRDVLEMDPVHLVLIRDFYNHDRSNSGLMLIPKDVEQIWQDAQGKENTHNGQDGNFLNTQRHSIMQNYVSGIVSYKADQCYTEPKGRILCFHGKPKPHQTEGWAKDVWDQYTATPNL